MPDAIESYWGIPDGPPAADSAPVTLLKEQAELLAEVTRGRVTGEVKESAEGGTVYASLYMGVPAMGDYQFKLLTIAHPLTADPSNPFPIKAWDSFGSGTRAIDDTIPDMASFDRYLKTLLSSQPVRAAIASFLKYSTDRVAS